MQTPAGNFGSLTLLQALYEARRTALDEIIGNRLLDQEAEARGIDRATLTEREVASRVATPTEADVNGWYQANSARVQGASLEQVKEPIRELLVRERGLAARQQYLDTLRAKATVTIALDPPRAKVAEGGGAARGPADAPVAIVEFSDFECPYCLRVFPTVTELLKTYGDRIRLAYRHYPLPNHPNARPAAEASACANEQGKFWQYHDRLFSNPGKLSGEDLKQHAVELGPELHGVQRVRGRPHVSEGCRHRYRGRRSGRRDGHARLLHQRTAHLWRDADRKLQTDHRRGTGPETMRWQISGFTFLLLASLAPPRLHLAPLG